MDMYDDPNYTQKPLSHYECVINEKALKNIQTEQVKLEAFDAMEQLEGWCTKFKASVLMSLIFKTKPQKIVEIGVWGGKSLVPMAFAMKALGRGKVYGIDPWSASESIQGMDGVNKEWWGSIDHNAIYQGLVRKIAQFQLKSYVKLVRSTSENAPLISDIDILHIDGNHSEETSFFDVMKWVPLVKSGGLIIFDDTTWGTTARAVQWLNANYTKISDYHEDNDWGIWVKS